MKVLKLDVTHELIGSKALNLKVIERSGCKVPETFVLFNEHINTKLVERSKANILRDVEEHLDEDKLYAVRSAKGIEDSEDNSFAGIFRSVLNVKKKNIYKALVEVAKSYDKVSHKHKEEPYDLLAIDHSRAVKDAILIQEMITPLYSGVLFSRNPVNNEDEMMLEMVEGLGDQLDQEGIDPLRASFKKGILTYDDRLVESDSTWLNRVFKEAFKVRKQFGGAIDCEWVYDGVNIFWLQVRPVTALSSIKVFENSIAKDYIQDVMKPLEFDIMTKTVVKSWIKLIREIDDKINVDYNSIVKSFYYRPYFNHEIIREILDEIGLDHKDVEVIVQFDGENFKSSFTLLAKAFFHLGGWVEFFATRQKKIHQSYARLEILRDKFSSMKAQINTVKTIEEFMATFNKLKELYLESEYLNLLIRIGSLKSRRKYENELLVISEVKAECIQCINECGGIFGAFLVELGYIESNDDLLYIEEDILVEIVQQDPNKKELMDRVNTHKKLFEEHKNSILPKVIHGEENPILAISKENKEILTGIAMSKGRTEGVAKIITIDDEMDMIKPNEIVILPFADMVFEPVLANAKGLILKTGGILSHMAILSRERNVPAVTTVKDIEKIKDGMRIAVDAYSGEVILLED